MKKRLSKKTLISVCTLIAALIIWTMWSNTALMLSTVTVSSNRIPAAFNGFRIRCRADEQVSNRSLSALFLYNHR